MFKTLVVTALLLATPTPNRSSCPCEKFPFLEGAEYGHMTATVLEKKPIRKIRGRISDRLGEPVAKAKVYVWRRPSTISDEEFSSGNYNFDEYENRLLACETGADGRFCFNDLLAGKYQVCASGPGFNSTCALVTLKPKSVRNGFALVLDPGT
jgi:protocatechuate 3,4-dioxygenase beta subunit